MSDSEDDSAPRFAVVTDEDINIVMEKRQAKATKYSTKSAVKTFTDFLLQTGIMTVGDEESDDDFTEWEIPKLADALKRFYVGARSKTGELYKKSTLNGIKFGIARHIKEKCSIDIVGDPAFTEANQVFKGQVVELKRQGKASTDHYPEIEPEDLSKMYQSFNLSKPTDLQEKVWLDIMLYFIRRGRENLWELSKNHYKVTLHLNYW